MKYQAPFNNGGDADAPWVNGNPSTGTEGSIPSAAAFEQPLRELHALIAKSGITPSDADLTQLAQAVRSQALNYRAVGGTANALTVSLDPVPAAYTALVGTPLRLLIATTNTGTATLNVNGLGAKTIKRVGGAALQAGDLPASGVLEVVYDGTDFQVATFSPTTARAKGSLIAARLFTSSGTYTPTAGTAAVRVTVTAGGGGGGSAAATSSGQYSAGGGGGGGDTQVGYFTAGFAGVAMTVGNGGGGGGGGGGPGGVGGTSSFGSLVTCPGGVGGSGGGQMPTGTVAFQSGGSGGTGGSGGNIGSFPGVQGGYSAGSTIDNFCSGNGGASYWGAGASAAFSSTFVGGAGMARGSGGSGAGSRQNPGSGVNGGSGSPGVILVEEYA